MSPLYVQAPRDEFHNSFARIYAMKCPHLIKWLTYACKAKENMYFPSSFQLHEYCKSKLHRKCPFYGASISSEEIESTISYADTQI